MGHLQNGGQQQCVKKRLAQIQNSFGHFTSTTHYFARLVTSWAEMEEMEDARCPINDTGIFHFCIIK